MARTSSAPDVVVWHNPRCTKSREALAWLEERGISPTIVRYLDTPPSADEIERVLGLLGVEPRALMRKKEAPYRDLALDDASRTRGELVRAMAAHPILIERPVVIRGGAAVIARPTERIADLLR
ncbi:MAG: arsenate reductase (glutaredoxin) [Deltaproteobacteria bacterium]|nr:arsenate reductase (glutaredoxin) [Deltaproteobacteria bacterium]